MGNMPHNGKGRARKFDGRNVEMVADVKQPVLCAPASQGTKGELIYRGLDLELNRARFLWPNTPGLIVVPVVLGLTTCALDHD